MDSQFNVTDHDFDNFIHNLQPERFSVIAADFLTHHVGEGQHRVSRGEVTGLDGASLSCPIGVAKNIAIHYFAVSIAEYVLMIAIGTKVLKAKKN